MENTRTFVINGKKQYVLAYIVSLLFLVIGIVRLVERFSKGSPGTVLVCILLLVFHLTMIKHMSSSVALKARGVCYKSLFGSKRYLWNEIADCGIVCKKRLGRHGTYLVYTLYFSNRDGARDKASRRLPFDGIRMNLRKQDVELITCELRDFARLYANVDPQIAEKW